jgi:hypothetical protein
MKSAKQHHFRIRAPFARGSVRPKVEQLEQRLQPGSMLMGFLGWLASGDAFGLVDQEATTGAWLDGSANRAQVEMARPLADMSASLFRSTNLPAAAPTGGHEEAVRSSAHAATAMDIWQADDWLDSLLVTRAGVASTAVPPGPPIAAVRGAESSGAIPGIGHTAALAAGSLGGPFGATGTDVLQHHLNATRDGLYIDPLMTQKAAANIHRDMTFDATLTGPTYAQPLYVSDGPGGQAAFIVATEQNVVVALSAADGSELWRVDGQTLGTPVSRSQLPCGDIDPLGITGTPVIDAKARLIYLDAMTTPDGGLTKQHLIYALSLDDGSVQPGWPVDVNSAVPGFNSTVQNQRGALILNNGYLYVPYGGHFGDCGNYHGRVVAVSLTDPTMVSSYATQANLGGIWAAGGLASDGTSVYAATGNTSGAVNWGGGEAIIRLGDGATFSGDPADYFAPTNWRSLDATDLDIGGSGPLLVDVPGASPSQLVVSLGKDGNAYLLDRGYLGGIGGELQTLHVNSGQIINAAATYTTANATYVVFTAYSGSGLGCPAGQSGNLVALSITASSPPTMSVAWCANNPGRGSPIVTTSDGSSDPVVWTTGTEPSSDNRLRGYDGDTGAVIYDGGKSAELLSSVRRFQTPIEVNGRIIVASDNRLYAFTTN